MRAGLGSCKFAAIAAIAAVALAVVARPARAVAADAEVPPGYAVMVFDNTSRVAAMEWMRIAVPFVLGEKLEAHRGMRPTYGALVVPDGAPPERTDAASVAAIAAAAGADYVWSGSLERASNWDLIATFTLWKVEDGQAVEIGTVRRRGDFNAIHHMTGDAIVELCAIAGLPADAIAQDAARAAPTGDHYAFTLFGRGLLWLHGLGAQPDTERARKSLERSVFIDPEFAEAHRVLGTLHLREGRTGKARARMAYALDINPQYFAALAAMAQLSYADGKLDDAQGRVEKMLEQRPWDAELRFLRGKMLWEVGDIEGSYRELKLVVRAVPNHLPARRILVLIHASRGQGADLVTELETVASLDPEDVETQLDLAAAYVAVGREDKAIATYKDIIRKDRDHKHALKFLGDLHRKRGELDLAIQYYKQALVAHPADPRFYFLLGSTYVEAGDDDHARGIYRRAQRFKSYLPEVYLNLGAISYREGRLGQAVWYFKRALQRRPRHAGLRYNYALALSAQGKPHEALEHIAIGLEIEPRNAELYYLRGVVLLRTGDALGAKLAFQTALELQPDHVDAAHNLKLIEQMEQRAKEGEIRRERPQ